MASTYIGPLKFQNPTNGEKYYASGISDNMAGYFYKSKYYSIEKTYTSPTMFEIEDIGILVTESIDGYRMDLKKSYIWIVFPMLCLAIHNSFIRNHVTDEYFGNIPLPTPDIQKILSAIGEAHRMYQYLIQLLKSKHRFAEIILDLRNWNKNFINPCILRNIAQTYPYDKYIRMSGFNKFSKNGIYSFLENYTRFDTKEFHPKEFHPKEFHIFGSIAKKIGSIGKYITTFNENPIEESNFYSNWTPKIFSNECFTYANKSSNDEIFFVNTSNRMSSCISREKIKKTFLKSLNVQDGIYVEMISDDEYKPSDFFYQLYLNSPELVIIDENTRLFMENIPKEVRFIKLFEHRRVKVIQISDVGTFPDKKYDTAVHRIEWMM